MTMKSTDGSSSASGSKRLLLVEYRCVSCGYGVVVSRLPEACPMCRQPMWQPAGSDSRLVSSEPNGDAPTA